MCTYVCVHAKINTCIYMCVRVCMCVLNIRHFSISSDPLCCCRLLWKQSPSYERWAPSLSSLGLLVLRPHSPRLLFALCVCVCARVPCKEGYPYPHSSGHGAVREMLDSKKAQASCRTPWPSEQLL